MTGQNRHEAPEVGAMVGRMLNALIRRAAEGDTEAVEQLQAVEQLAAHAYSAGLAVAHDAGGYSWGELSAVTGNSRQNLSQRVARLQPAACAGVDVDGHPMCVGMKRCRQAS